MSASDKIDKSGGYIINTHKLSPSQHIKTSGIITPTVPFSITGGNSLARTRQPWPVATVALSYDSFWTTNATVGGNSGLLSGILTGADVQADMVITPVDYRVVAKAVAMGQAQTLTNSAWGVGPTVEWGRVGTTGANEVWLWTSANTAISLHTLPGYGLSPASYIGPHFSGYYGNKALFRSTINGGPTLFQWFDVNAMSWGSVISGPATVWHHHDGFIGYQRLYDPTDDSIWFPAYNGLGYICKIASNGTTTVYPTAVPTNYPHLNQMAVLEGRAFIFAKDAANQFLTNVKEYNFATNAWDQRAQIWTQALNGEGPWGYTGNAILFDDFTLAYHSPTIMNIGLVDLNGTATTYLGLAMVNYGSEVYNKGYASLFGSGSHNFFAGFANALWRIRYDPALLASNDYNWSLVGARINGFDTYTGPSDARLSSGVQNYCFNTYNMGWGPANK